MLLKIVTTLSILASIPAMAKTDSVRTCNLENMESFVFEQVKTKIEEVTKGRAKIVAESFEMNPVMAHPIKDNKEDTSKPKEHINFTDPNLLQKLAIWLLTGTSKKFGMSIFEKMQASQIAFYLYDVTFKTERGSKILVESVRVLNPYMYEVLDLNEAHALKKVCVTGILNLDSQNFFGQTLGKAIGDSYKYGSTSWILSNKLVFKNEATGGLIQTADTYSVPAVITPLLLEFKELIAVDMR